MSGAPLPLASGDDDAARSRVLREHDHTAGVGRDLHVFLARQLRRANGYD